ncbi:uncharacterized protein LOC142572277 [Dermacentor variabilis]|uniref:uncharacterized protein LOC142572277 n=1 Tax=Dermacentor variabilis TaxID=34621 RepID=UPI003F5B77CE
MRAIWLLVQGTERGHRQSGTLWNNRIIQKATRLHVKNADEAEGLCLKGTPPVTVTFLKRRGVPSKQRLHSADRDNTKNPAFSLRTVGSPGIIIRIDYLITT